jgi:hypothetical protein
MQKSKIKTLTKLSPPQAEYLRTFIWGAHPQRDHSRFKKMNAEYLNPRVMELLELNKLPLPDNDPFYYVGVGPNGKSCHTITNVNVPDKGFNEVLAYGKIDLQSDNQTIVFASDEIKKTWYPQIHKVLNSLGREVEEI